MGTKKEAARASVSTGVAHDYAHTLEAMASEIRRLANERDSWRKACDRANQNINILLGQRERLATSLMEAGVKAEMVHAIQMGTSSEEER